MKKLLPILLPATLLMANSITSTKDDQKSLNVVIYNNNRALVSETREINVPKGNSTIKYEDIAASIIAPSLIVKSNNFSILEQNYEFDLISRKKLLDKYIGKDVSIIQENEYTGKSDTVQAKLLSNNDTPIFDINGKIVLGTPGRIELPSLPENLYARPTMNWEISANKAGKSNVNISYLTSSLSWKADYVLNLSDDDKSGALTGWVTLTNNSGTAFNNAKVKLVAGNVNTVSNSQRDGMPIMYKEAAMRADNSAVQEKSFFEYHLYTYPRNITINNRQTKQLNLLNAPKIKTEKKYTVSQRGYYNYSNNGKQELPVNVEIAFKTGKANGLNMPIPAGVVRIYKQDSDGSSVFVGENRVKHTPINEEISLKTGEAFDIKAESRQTSFKKINNKTTVSEYEVEIRNHKKSAVTVTVKVPVSGLWKVTSNSKYTKLNANLVSFDVKVPANGKSTLKYSVEHKIK